MSEIDPDPLKVHGINMQVDFVERPACLTCKQWVISPDGTPDPVKCPTCGGALTTGIRPEAGY